MNQSASDDDRIALEDKAFLEYVEYLRRQPPRQGFPRKTITDLAIEYGVGPINAEEIMAIVRGSSRDDSEEIR
jgi:hypothetical protein